MKKFFLLLCFSVSLYGATYNVTTNANSGAGSLREALTSILTTSAASDTVDMSSISGQTITLSSDLPVLGSQYSSGTKTVDIQGNDVTINGASSYQGIAIIKLRTPTMNVTMSDLNFTSCRVVGGNGGNGSAGGGGGAGHGGAIFVDEDCHLTISGCAFTSNHAQGGNGGDGGSLFGGSGGGGSGNGANGGSSRSDDDGTCGGGGFRSAGGAPNSAAAEGGKGGGGGGGAGWLGGGVDVSGGLGSEAFVAFPSTEYATGGGGGGAGSAGGNASGTTPGTGGGSGAFSSSDYEGGDGSTSNASNGGSLGGGGGGGGRIQLTSGIGGSGGRGGGGGGARGQFSTTAIGGSGGDFGGGGGGSNGNTGGNGGDGGYGGGGGGGGRDTLNVGGDSGASGVDAGGAGGAYGGARGTQVLTGFGQGGLSSTNAGGGGGNGCGGAIAVRSGGSLTIGSGCSFSNNTVVGGSAGAGGGIGIDAPTDGIGFGTDVYLQGIPGSTTETLTVTGDVTLASTASSTALGLSRSANISPAFIKEGAGNLTINSGQFRNDVTINDGTLTLTDINSLNILMDDIFINEGTLALNYDDATAPCDFSFGNANSTFSTNNNYTINTLVKGSGTLNKSGTGTLTLSNGSNTISGGFQVNAGTLSTTANGAVPNDSDLTMEGGTFSIGTATVNLGSLSGSSSSAVVAVQTNALTITQATNATYAGTFTSSNATATIEKAGASRLTLTGTSSGFTGNVTVSAGDLNLNGLLGGNVIVSSGGTLSGNGTISGNLTSSGTVSPGNSIGTTTILGDLTLNNDSTTEIEINDALQSDLLDVTGAANLDGTLNIVVIPGSYSEGSSWTIIEAGGGVSGTFATVTDNDSELDFTITYNADSVVISLPTSGIVNGFNIFNTNLNGYNVNRLSDNLTRLNEGTALFLDTDLFNIVNSLIGQQPQTIEDAMLRMNGSPYTSINRMLAKNTEFLADMYSPLKRDTLCCHSPCREEENRIFFVPFSGYFNHHAVQKESGYDSYVTGLGFGVERLFTEEWSVGTGLVWNATDIVWKANRGNTFLSNYYLSLFTSYLGKRVLFNFSVLGGLNRVTSERKIDFLTTHREAREKHFSEELVTNLYLAALIGPENYKIIPYGRISSDTVFQPSIKEKKAGSLSLRIEDAIEAMVITELGFQFKPQWKVGDNCLGLSLWTSITEEFPITKYTLTSHFENQTLPFTVRGYTKTEEYYEAGVSFSWSIKECTLFEISGSTQWGKQIDVYKGEAKAGFAF